MQRRWWVRGAVLLLLLVMVMEVGLSTRQESPSWDEGSGRSAEGFTRKRFSNLCVQRRVTTTKCPYVASNVSKLSGERSGAERVR